MKLLVDTHVFLWFITADARISQLAKSAIQSSANSKFISLASIWEIGIKFSSGKLQLAEPFDIIIPREIQNNGFVLLPIEMRHIVRAATLHFHHRDPFDRMLIAQADVEQMQLVSADAAFDAYAVARLW